MKKAKGELSLWSKIAFGMGDIYGGGSMIIVGIYYLYFLTDVVGLSPALAGTVLLVSKIWDAVNDPLMGVITDRTRTRYGRRRPFLLAGVAFIFLSYFMLWYPVSYESEAARFAFVLLAYFFFDAVITLVMVPYNALASELTLDYAERTSLISIRMGFSMFSSILCAVVPMEIVKMIPDVRTGHMVMGASFGLFFALPFLATFFYTKERPEFQEVLPDFNLVKAYREPFKIKSFLHVMSMYLFSFLAMDVVMAIVIYFMTHYMKRGGDTNYVLGALLITQLLVIPAYYWLSRKTSKKTGFITAVCLWMAVMVYSFFITPASGRASVFIFGCAMGLATGGVVVMIYAIFPDLPDVDELVTGMRREGVYAGLLTFMRKLSSALAIFLISQAISLAGYVPPVSETIDGVTKLVQQPQSGAFLLVLRAVFAAVPMVLLVFCLFFALRFPLSPQVHARLKDFLARRRAGAMTDELAAEEKRLKDILV